MGLGLWTALQAHRVQHGSPISPAYLPDISLYLPISHRVQHGALSRAEAHHQLPALPAEQPTCLGLGFGFGFGLGFGFGFVLGLGLGLGLTLTLTSPASGAAHPARA